ncbi:hypothetical protein ACPRSC_23250, partial [Enterobacter asburiae]
MKGSNKSRWAIAAGIIVVVLAAAWYWHSQSANSAAPAGANIQSPAFYTHLRAHETSAHLVCR